MSTENLDDLEALFEATRAEAERAATAATASTPVEASTVEAIQAEASNGSPITELKVGTCPNAQDGELCIHCTCGNARQIRDRLGQITRNLHESLQALRLDRSLADVAAAIPDARNRLKYVTDMCERSAEKVLDTLDELTPLQQATRDDSAALLVQWDALIERGERPSAGYREMFLNTRSALAATIARSERTATLHTDIMMAQDFQDLTGQVCRKIDAITQKIEAELVTLLIESAPEDQRARHQEMLEGPQVVEGREDAVSSQSEVDDLLSELGF